MPITLMTASDIELGQATGLHTDRYELTMLDAAIADGTAQRRAVFEVFARHLPAGMDFGVVGGVDRLIETLKDFRFDAPELDWLQQHQVVSPSGLAFLAEYSFGGSIVGYPDGEIWFPGSPILTIDGTFGEAVLLETLVLSMLNHGSAIASAAAKIRQAAGRTTLIEMGSRRTHDAAAAVDTARMAWVGGFDATSNLAAGQQYGIPTAGTAAHAWTLAHDTEVDAFESQIRHLGIETTLLVDTFDIPTGIAAAVQAAQNAGAKGPGSIRIDSGDLDFEIRRARVQLNTLGAIDTKIVVSGDLDAHKISRLVSHKAPVDGFGIGTNLVAAAPPGLVYKLVAIETFTGELRPVAKRSASKIGTGGRKQAYRSYDRRGCLTTETVVVEGPFPSEGATVAFPLYADHQPMVQVDRPTATSLARNRCRQAVRTIVGPVRTVLQQHPSPKETS